MINNYKTELMYARVFEKAAFGIKWAQKIQTKQFPLPIGQYWHVALDYEGHIYDKETHAPIWSSDRNNGRFLGNDWMDDDWIKAFYKCDPSV
ncbi:MAG: hypothetical protein IJK73_04770 [Bacteroidales bacterium]|nr:hypothetical protein [Bacteroidales bacterium]